jgi:endoplasmic reticulum resident protein 44
MSLYNWVNIKCTPLVQEITFENAEELTELGLPFLILFHKADDLKSLEKFKNEVKRQLMHERSKLIIIFIQQKCHHN